MHQAAAADIKSLARELEAQKEKTRLEEMAKEEMAQNAESLEVNFYPCKYMHGEWLGFLTVLLMFVLPLESCVF